MKPITSSHCFHGPLNRPKLPGIPGIGTFAGHTCHTSRWDYGYTGGDSGGGLTGLKDKRVGIIGTGATAVQCIPHLGEWAKELFVFQRTPSSVDERNNRPTDPAWVRSVRDDCRESDVAFFFKQWGGVRPKSGGRILQGREWSDYPRVIESAAA